MGRLLLGTALALGLGPAAVAEPTVFAAASTAKALDAVLAAWDEGATASYASSGTLARQIEAGAPADLFLSANPEWMDRLAERGLIVAGTERALLSNAIVVIGPEGAAPIAHGPGALAAALGDERLAMGDPAHAPVGRYARATLQAMDCWTDVADRLAPTRDTRTTVALVARGEAGLGLVYASDAAGVTGVSVLARPPEHAQPEILYPVALVEGGADPEGAARLLDFLASDEAAAIFAAHGFEVAAP